LLEGWAFGVIIVCVKAAKLSLVTKEKTPKGHKESSEDYLPVIEGEDADLKFATGGLLRCGRQ
jgi:hypothetical protein